MNKKIIILVIIVILLAVGLSGCNNKNLDSRFVGTWEYKNWPDRFPTMKLFSDGTGFVGDKSITWEIDGAGDLVFNRESSSPRLYHINFSNDEKELTLTVPVVGMARTYIKK